MPLLRLLPVLPLLSLAGCTEHIPGEIVGAYRITMRLEENTCGDGAVYLDDGHTYAAELRQEGAKGFWRLSGKPALPGSYDAGRFQFRFSSVVASAEQDGGPGCQLVQDEVLSGAVAMGGASDAGASDAAPEQDAADAADGDAAVEADAGIYAGALPASGLIGEHMLTIKPAAGADCTVALAPLGPFAALPCTVRYSLRGVSRKPF